MTANGAAGETQKAIKSVLGVDQLSDAEVNEAVKQLTELLLSMDKKVALSIANAIWYTDELTLKETFGQLIQEYYGGRIAALNLEQAEAAKHTINGWVEQKNEGKIKNLLDMITPDDVMFLVNAIYFKADWQYQFDKGRTQDEPFYLENGEQINVPTMFSKGVKLRTHYEEQFRMLEIPYGNGQFNMTILLPNPRYTTDDVLEMLNADDFSRWLSEADTFSTALYLPKFKSAFKMELKAPLSELGMGRAFSPGADFSNFFQASPNLQLDRVIHQAFIEVNETGSEAAAATVVAVANYSINSPQVPVSIHIDRPFLYFIREKHSGAILFAGKMLNPG